MTPDEPIPNAPAMADVGIGSEVELPTDISEKVQAATPETHDFREVQDRSGMLMQAYARPAGDQRARLDHRVHGPNGQILTCSQCRIEVFRVFCSAVGPYIQIICANEECGAMYPVLEMTPVQMNARIAIAHSLPVPSELKGTGSLAGNRAQRRDAERNRSRRR